MAGVECIDAGIRVLIEAVEPRQVPLPFIVVEVSKDSRAGRFVIKNKPAEIARKILNAEAARDEIVALGDICQMNLRK